MIPNKTRKELAQNIIDQILYDKSPMINRTYINSKKGEKRNRDKDGESKSNSKESRKTGNIEEIPHEVLSQIYSFLGIDELNVLGLVSTEFLLKKMDFEGPVKALEKSIVYNITKDFEISKIIVNPMMENLVISYPITRKNLFNILDKISKKKNPNVTSKELILNSINIDAFDPNDTFGDVDKFDFLQFLDGCNIVRISGNKYKSEYIQLKNTKIITLHDCYVPIDVFENFENVEALFLDGCQFAEISRFPRFNCKKLTTFSIKNIFYETDISLIKYVIMANPQLTSIEIRVSEDLDIRRFDFSVGLKELILQGVKPNCLSQIFSNLINLEKLEICISDSLDEDVIIPDNITNLKKLKFFNLRFANGLDGTFPFIFENIENFRKITGWDVVKPMFNCPVTTIDETQYENYTNKEIFHTFSDVMIKNNTRDPRLIYNLGEIKLDDFIANNLDRIYLFSTIEQKFKITDFDDDDDESKIYENTFNGFDVGISILNDPGINRKFEGSITYMHVEKSIIHRELFERLTHLKVLRIIDCKPRFRDYVKLPVLNDLEYLEITRSDIDLGKYISIRFLMTYYPKLKSLVLDMHNRELTKADYLLLYPLITLKLTNTGNYLSSFLLLPNLKTLELDFICGKPIHDNFYNLSDKVGVTKLCITNTWVSMFDNNVFIILSDTLRHLDLSRIRYINPGIPFNNDHISSLHKLEYLNVIGTEINDFTPQKKLRELVIDDPKLIKNGLNIMLSHLTVQPYLIMTNGIIHHMIHEISDGLDLNKFINLRVLIINSENWVTDNHISKLVDLETLHVLKSEFLTNDAFKNLYSLTDVDLKHTKVTEDIIKTCLELQKLSINHKVQNINDLRIKFKIDFSKSTLPKNVTNDLMIDVEHHNPIIDNLDDTMISNGVNLSRDHITFKIYEDANKSMDFDLFKDLKKVAVKCRTNVDKIIEIASNYSIYKNKYI